MDGLLDGKRILITGGTGSLGKALLRTLLHGDYGRPAQVVVFSRDEAKQHEVRLAFRKLRAATEEVIYEDFEQLLQFQIGDVRDFNSVARAVRKADVIVNAAALKQVPNCEYFPHEAVRTNVDGAENLVRALETLEHTVETVVGVSTDKACKPVNVMGMTKAIQERLLVQANLRCPNTRFICVRYGNVLATRGSVIPLFLSQIGSGGPVTITDPAMTRFLLSLDRAVKTIMDAYRDAGRGEIFIPRIPSSLITNVAQALIGERRIAIANTGIRPGEKVHEILVSEDEGFRTEIRKDYYVIRPVLAEIGATTPLQRALNGEYSSADHVMDLEATQTLLRDNQLMPDQIEGRRFFGELLQ
ncbi:MAG TPA: polysaccharide biosynthesis protein [Casimicrobiaceae bacterium]|nr:polysaccharide biosynthesis protein [Casimicrobiaceae bacterium]